MTAVLNIIPFQDSTSGVSQGTSLSFGYDHVMGVLVVPIALIMPLMVNDSWGLPQISTPGSMVSVWPVFRVAVSVSINGLSIGDQFSELNVPRT